MIQNCFPAQCIKIVIGRVLSNFDDTLIILKILWASKPILSIPKLAPNLSILTHFPLNGGSETSWLLRSGPPPPPSTDKYKSVLSWVSPHFAESWLADFARLHWLCGINWCLTWFTHKAALWIYFKLFQDLARTLCFTWLRIIFSHLLFKHLVKLILSWLVQNLDLTGKKRHLDQGGIELRSLVQKAFIKASWADHWLFGWMA